MSSTSLVKGEDAAADIGSKLLLLGAMIFIIGLLIAALGGLGAVMSLFGGAHTAAPAVADAAATAAPAAGAAAAPSAATAPASPPVWLFGLIGMAIGAVISLLAGFILSRSHSDEG